MKFPYTDISCWSVSEPWWTEQGKPEFFPPELPWLEREDENVESFPHPHSSPVNMVNQIEFKKMTEYSCQHDFLKRRMSSLLNG